jgi:cytochrome c553
VQHSIILRAAWALTICLVVVAAAFAWATNQRERLVAAAAAASPPSTAAASPYGPAVQDPEARRAVVTATWEKRCAKCHEAEEMAEWLATQDGDKEAALAAFLSQHGKSSAEENQLLAAWFAAGESL